MKNYKLKKILNNKTQIIKNQKYIICLTIKISRFSFEIVKKQCRTIKKKMKIF